MCDGQFASLVSGHEALRDLHQAERKAWKAVETMLYDLLFDERRLADHLADALRSLEPTVVATALENHATVRSGWPTP